MTQLAPVRSWGPVSERDSAFELCERIAPVAILYGIGARLAVSEQNSSRRLLKELHRLGRKKIPVRGMISERGALDRSSLRALNCYLEHSYGKISRQALRSGQLHRVCWDNIQREVGLRWRR